MELKIDHLASQSDAEDDAEGDQIHDDGRASRADEREGDACDRHDTHGHADILKDLKEKHGSQTDDDQITVGVLGAFRNAHDAVYEKAIQTDDDAAADKTKFLADDGEDEVGFRHRKVVERLLLPLEQPFPEKASGADGNLGVPDMIICADAQIVRVEKGVDSGSLVIRHEKIGQRHASAYACRAAPVDLSIDARRIDHDDHHEADDEGVSHVLYEDEQDERGGHDDRFDQTFEILELVGVLRQVFRKDEDKEDLYDFTGLNRRHSQVEPRSGAELCHAEGRVHQKHADDAKHI